MPKALVTGASGFVGSRLTQLLLDAHFEVVVLLRDPKRINPKLGEQCKIIVGDLENKESLVKAVDSVDFIFHCAALCAIWGHYNDFYKANVLGTENLLEAALRVPHLKRFVHISSTDVYGYPRYPCDEDGRIQESRRLPYNKTKAKGDKLAQSYFQKHKLPVTILRPSNIYGPNDPNFVKEICDMICDGVLFTISGGKAKFGITHVDSVANCAILAAQSPKALGEAFNVVDDFHETFRDFTNMCTDEMLNKKVIKKRPFVVPLPFLFAYLLAIFLEFFHTLFRLKQRPFLTRHGLLLIGVAQNFPCEKAKRVLGFEPAFSMEQGIQNSVQAYVINKRK